jgi:ATP-binding cassette subfamily G (WHITE) protein 2 (PDR)
MFQLMLACGTDCLCSFVPTYPNLTGETFICSVVGAVAGQTNVSGDAYVQAGFQYSYYHIWQDLGIVISFWVFFLSAYLIASELNSSTSDTAEVLLFLRGREGKDLQNGGNDDDQRELLAAGAVGKENKSEDAETTRAQKGIFTWRDVVYDIRIKDEPRRLLDHVSGWVKPGTLTALMGVSGAGKTTLLDVLAQRTSVGVITGEMLVNGKPLDSSFRRKTGMTHEVSESHWIELLILGQVMYNNKTSILRPQPSVKHCVLAQCYGSPNPFQERRNMITWKM